MRIWTPYPFIRFTACFSLGILANRLIEEHFKLILALFFVFILFYGTLYHLSNKKIFSFYSSWLGLLAMIILLLVGYLRTYQFRETNDPPHISHLQGKIAYYEAEVVSPPEENEKGISSEIAVKKVNIEGKWKKATGKVKLYIRKERDTDHLAYGDLMLIKGFCQPVKETLNPGAFDYKAYLASQNIYFTDYIGAQDFIIFSKNDNFSVIGYASQIQRAFAKVIKKYVEDASAQSIVLALGLGMKKDIEKPLLQAYATAGVMHVLAVSGLHVGIIYTVLLFVFGWLRRRGFKWLFAFICLGLLWSFAFITGLSPSVLRAVTMFSFFIIAKASHRQTNAYNTLAASAFLLLFLNPFFIMSVGFQLSYLAVLGILFLFPRIYKLYKAPYKSLDMIWKLCCVSLAAQLAVFPVSIYYFHQFPLYFLLANLILVPGAFLMLSLALSILALNFFPPMASFLGDMLSFVVGQINNFVYGISHLPLSRLSSLYISEVQTFLVIGILVSIMAFAHYKRIAWLVVVTGLCCSFQAVTLKRQWHKYHRKQITYYSINHSGVLSFMEGDFYTIIFTGGRKLSESDFNYAVQPNLVRKGYAAYYPCTGQAEKSNKGIQSARFAYGTLIIWNGYKLLLIDKPFKENFSFKEKVKVDVLIVEGNALKSLKNLPENLIFNQLVIGNSCKYYIADQLIEEAKSVNLAFVHPLSTGAWVIDLDK